MNRDLLSKIVIFATGAGIGSVVTWKLLKTKYEQIAQEEIESVREAFSKRNAEADDDMTVENISDATVEEGFDIDISMESKSKYRSIVNSMNYSTESTEKIKEKIKEEEEEAEMSEPYVISPEEFGDSDYATITLWYYTDGVVANDDGKIVENTDELIGKDFADHFGDYEEDPDSVYVRNDDMEVDYEILKDYRAYSEIS